MGIVSDDLEFIKSEATRVAGEIENYPPTKIIAIMYSIQKYDAADYTVNDTPKLNVTVLNAFTGENGKLNVQVEVNDNELNKLDMMQAAKLGTYGQRATMELIEK